VFLFLLPFLSTEKVPVEKTYKGKSGSHLSDYVSIRVQLAISANCKKLSEKSWFFAIEM
jgi:hypothetical protein